MESKTLIKEGGEMEFLEVLQNIVPLAIPANMFLVPALVIGGLGIWAIGAYLISR